MYCRCKLPPQVGSITYSEWVQGFGWVRHAFRIYGLPLAEPKASKY